MKTNPVDDSPETGAQQDDETSRFHVQDGIYFARVEGGSVRLIITETPKRNSPVLRELTMPAAVWASVIASMSACGETPASYKLACEVHQDSVLVATAAAARAKEQAQTADEGRVYERGERVFVISEERPGTVTMRRSLVTADRFDYSVHLDGGDNASGQYRPDDLRELHEPTQTSEQEAEARGDLAAPIRDLDTALSIAITRGHCSEGHAWADGFPLNCPECHAVSAAADHAANAVEYATLARSDVTGPTRVGLASKLDEREQQEITKYRHAYEDGDTIEAGLHAVAAAAFREAAARARGENPADEKATNGS